MKLSNILITGFTLSCALAINISKASESMLIEETGHLNYSQEGHGQRQVASATTVITKIFRNKAIVDVSQSFANDTKETINGEYFFPLPYNSRLMDFQMNTDFQVNEEMPNPTVSLLESDQLKIKYQYELVDDSPYHASVMGFPAKPNLPLLDSQPEKHINKELIAKN